MKQRRTNTYDDKVCHWLSKTGDLDTKSEVRYGFIRNSDYTIRWIWPMTNKKPVFLTFYSTTTLRASAFSFLCKLVFALRLQNIVFSSFKGPKLLGNIGFNIDPTQPWALFTGTKGPNRKLLITGKTFGAKDTIVKLPVGSRALKLVNHEKNALIEINKWSVKGLQNPKIIPSSDGSLQTGLVHGNRCSDWTEKHTTALESLTANSKMTAHPEVSKTLKDIRIRVSQLKSYRSVPNGITRKLNLLISKLKAEDVETVMTHGDFTPWNTFVNEDGIAVYDWEMSKRRTYGFDAFHFIIQNSILVDRISWVKIYEKLMQHLLPDLFHNDKDKLHTYLSYYLLDNVSYYLEVYENQAVWHQQIHWLLRTWNEAISMMLTRYMPERELLLIDFFDLLHGKEYATLKFHAGIPENLSMYSDLDLCIRRKDSKEVIEQLSNHPLVFKLRKSNQSFMTNLGISTHDGSFLSIDLINQIKRKNLVFANISDIISNAQTNAYGVKTAALKDEARYVTFFHLLNGSETPTRYKSALLEYDLTKVTNASLKQRSKAALNFINGSAHNQGANRFRNTLLYGFDVLQRVFQRKGFIVTFSGVDGAGKSTLIDIVKHRIEKQLRRPIVVLRHRPSVLPIISELIKGKPAGEPKIHQPHDGNNSSTFSSFVRFAYYFIDYLFGQFYILFRYVLRGKVVVYDRYYYDFISDAKRSNIVLPSWVARIGLKLLIKPDINFFIYADSETILERKQELDKPTIERLTNSYKTLFSDLGKSAKQQFLSVENIQLDNTVNTLMSQITKVNSI